MNPPELRLPMITVMTSRDAHLIFDVLHSAAQGNRRRMPPGVANIEDLTAVMRGGVAFFIAYASGDATTAQVPAGAIGYRWERGSLRIFHVAVKEAYQRNGVGLRLIQAVEAVGLALGTTIVTLTVGSESNQRQLFERAGYNPTSSPQAADRVAFRKAFGERLV